MKKHLVFLAAAMLVLTSCSTSTFFGASPSNIHTIAMVEPFSYVTDAVGYRATDYLPTQSRFNHELVEDLVMAMMPVETEVSVGFDYVRPDYNLLQWTRELARISSSDARYLVIPKEIRDAVKNSGCPYGLVVMDVGFVKDTDQYVLEEVLGVTASVLDYVLNGKRTTYWGSSEEYRNGVYALVFDSQTGKVLWFGSRPDQSDVNPLNPSQLRRQLTTLFKDYLP